MNNTRSFGMLLLIVVFSAASALLVWASYDSEGWRSVGRGVYVNTRTIANPGSALPSLWVKIEPPRNSRLYNWSRHQLRRSGKDYRAYAYTAFLAEIDCSGVGQRIMSVLLYNRDKNIIHAMTSPGNDWDAVFDGEIADIVREKVCSMRHAGGSAPQTAVD